MVSFLQNEGIKFVPGKLYPDYYPDKPGGKIGRVLDCEFFDRRKLGELGKVYEQWQAGHLQFLLPPVRQLTCRKHSLALNISLK